jgi:hypothetical protein
MLLPVLVGGIGAAIIAAVTEIIFIARLTYKKVKEWFDKKKPLTESDKEKVAAAMKLALENGDVGYVQFIFDKKNSEIVDGQRIETKELDNELEQYHKGKALVIYE